MSLRLLAVSAFLVLLAAPAAAQPAPLAAPLLAFTTASQDAITLYEPATGAARQLRFSDGWHAVWGFAVDGCRLLYTLSDGAALPRAYTARLDGRDPQPLVTFDELPADDWGVWEPGAQPGGGQVGFTFIRRAPGPDGTLVQTTHIARVPVSGGTPELYSVTGREHEPEWSPDGAWLAYISYTERAPGADPASTAVPAPEGAAPDPGQTLLREADLWVVSADGQTKYRLTDFPTGSVRRPRWSPDGFLLSFIYAPSPNNDTFWMIGNSAGAIPTQLTFRWSLVLDTTWYPGSDAILAAARDILGEARNLLWRVPLVGTPDLEATSIAPTLAYADYPRFSPDARWLALRVEYGLALVETATGAVTLLDVLPGNTAPVWTPAAFQGEAACPEG